MIICDTSSARRITSYNVCYTKLLRLSSASQAPAETPEETRDQRRSEEEEKEQRDGPDADELSHAVVPRLSQGRWS